MCHSRKLSLGKARAGPVFPGKRESTNNVRHKALADPTRCLVEIPAFAGMTGLVYAKSEFFIC
ncbi:MAG: hypothetical protein A3G33_05430 [Omnitrophica bacterium RIFCSPLOWO2_12_FULL_44_17]|uniref:Uncharacterized protein n=1 Tax=Candidatus Danuiimicrobium aquiferis TaxID=1801832 RepID=A0A1G1L0R0_9BACT|nr:MAG: hypothetical protein A3E74_07320 [Omnitrophica bacterium RIFCSPHIGHO2_12_FULL_44_12]OGW98715.1 MAG: hypothetical protein A3G33_05430 [Omnitrophica bacterium RIFCSPLOWO2_12_FULL_44_17]OGX03106.1 MAG: hypothetical protein A3J12_05835 [Omnitrophica bacterium RIFCSPLOWO2_02_FULL_44_11]